MKSVKKIMKKSLMAAVKVLGLSSALSALSVSCIVGPCAYGPAPIEDTDDQSVENASENIVRNPESENNVDELK